MWENQYKTKQTHKDTPKKLEFSVQAPIKCHRLDLENMKILHENRNSLLKWDFIFGDWSNYHPNISR